MKAQNLTEEINRIKEILNFDNPSIIEEQLWKTLIKRVAPNLQKQFFADLEKTLGKKLTAATEEEVVTAIKSAEMATMRKLIAKEVYNAEKQTIDNILKKYDLTNKAQAKAALTELSANGVHPGLRREVVALSKAENKTARAAAPKPAVPKPAAPKPATPKLNVPDIERTITSSPIFSETEVLNKLKLSFPGAKSSHLAKMVENFKNANFKSQKSFDIAYRDAINAYEPIYQKHLLEPTIYKRMKGEYDKLGKYGKIMFWVVAIPGGYNLLKFVGVPVEGLTGWVIDSWKNIGKEQVKGVTKKNNDDNASSDSTENSEAKYQNNIDGFKIYASDNGVNATNAISLPGGIYKTKNDAIVDYKFVEKDPTTKLGTFEAE